MKGCAMSDDSTRVPAVMAEVEHELRRWRLAHPDATLTEIEAVLDTHLRDVRAGLLTALAEETPPDLGACSACGEPLVSRGRQTRTVRTQGEHALTLRRSYATCPACGAGLFPPR